MGTEHLHTPVNSEGRHGTVWARLGLLFDRSKVEAHILIALVCLLGDGPAFQTNLRIAYAAQAGFRVDKPTTVSGRARERLSDPGTVSLRILRASVPVVLSPVDGIPMLFHLSLQSV